jgi:hypothetical protein
MKATLQDRVFDTLTWDEDTETYSGAIAFRAGQVVEVQLVVNNSDEMSSREFNAFMAAARAQWQRIQADDTAFRNRAVALFEKAIKKASRPTVDAAVLKKSLALAGVEIHNTGMTRLLYEAATVWPKKRVSFYIDGSDRFGM